MKRTRATRRTSRTAARRSTSARARRLKGRIRGRAGTPARGGIARLVSEPATLPGSYGRTYIAVFPIHPYAVHACWEVTATALVRARKRLEAQAGDVRAVLRFHDVTVERATDATAFDVAVDFRARNWYVDLWSAGRTYVVELGLKTRGGEFRVVTRSRRVQTPRAEPVPAGAGRAAAGDRRRAPIQSPGDKRRAPIGEERALPLRATAGAPRGRASTGDRISTEPRPIGHEQHAAGDLADKSETAFFAGLSSRR
jgi:hypothetical protein